VGPNATTCFRDVRGRNGNMAVFRVAQSHASRPLIAMEISPYDAFGSELVGVPPMTKWTAIGFRAECHHPDAAAPPQSVQDRMR